MPFQPDRELDDTIARWDSELRLTQEFMPEDPMTAWRWSRRIDAEVTAEMQRHPEAEAMLASLRSDVQILLERARVASGKFHDESARRERDATARELGVFGPPFEQLRKPWPR